MEKTRENSNLRWKFKVNQLRGSTKAIDILMQEPRKFGFSKTVESQRIAVDENNVRLHEIIQETQERMMKEYETKRELACDNS